MMSTWNMACRLSITCNLIIHHQNNGTRVMMEDMVIKLRTLLIVQDKLVRKLYKLNNKTVLKTLVLNMKLLNLHLKMMIVLRYQQATGHFNLELTVEKRNWFVMCLETLIFRILMINIDLDSHQLHKIIIKQFQVKVYTKLREWRIIRITIVVKELNKIIVWKEVLAKICRLKVEIVIQENHFRIKRKTNLLKVT